MPDEPNVGERVPDVTGRFDDGTVFRLSELHARGPVVLFFYPRAFTKGCTAQACHFRDLGAEFKELGAQPIGVSRDETSTQARFRQTHDFEFPLVSDRDGSVARAFGAKRLGPLGSRRRTVVISAEGRLLGIFSSESDMERHADEALHLLRTGTSNGTGGEG